ncbi:TetR/AcrR family transcriptional regulator [Nocardia abscessus]|uniref:TetR/AcrR family transcriptional regulator n=1 Tax=Nocardia abscessus TaxID=120957 RepID=UPI0002D868E8|nr:TetR family transcriptional regulator C-terminal domain-containing protein [Nocardia abscessus]MCC3332233.1 TetR family transcriptional regulator C-terminal domain-containing protein [Nocardia abscessus]
MPKIVDHEERRRAISAAACQVIATKSLANTTVRDIAAEAGCTTGMVVHYFADKRQVLLAALTAATTAVAKRMTQVAAESTGLYELLCQCLPMDETRRVEWQVWIAFWDSATHDADLAREQRARYQAWREALELVLVSVGYPAGRALENAAELLMIVIDGIGIQAVFDPDRFPPDRQLQLLRHQTEHILTTLDAKCSSQP